MVIDEYIYPLSFLFSLNFGLATGVVVFFIKRNELVTPPSTAVMGFSIRPLYACLASSVKLPCVSARQGNE